MNAPSAASSASSASSGPAAVSSTPGSSAPALSTAAAPVAERPSRADFDAALNGGAYAVLPQFGVIDANGDDAATFLHSQLTNDTQHLEVAGARLAGYCSPKGRLLASFLAWRSGETIRLLVSKDIQAAVQKRLSMFVLRAKAKLTDASDALIVVGFAGDVRGALATQFDALPDGVHVSVDGPSGTLIRVPDAAGRLRYLWVGPRAVVEAGLASLDSAPDAAVNSAVKRVAPGVWDWLDIRAGEPRITQAVSEQFVPQMVNYDVLGGVNFRKGCYPGQEVVARSQYRGTIKRRTSLANVQLPEPADAAAPSAAHAGAELFHSDDPGQPCGMVVNAAAAPDGGVDLLAELKLAALESGSVHLGAADGPVLRMLPLPYALPTEV